MDLLDHYQGDLPNLCLVTDDPYRVKMIAAHYLDRVEIFSETRGQIGLIGDFNGIRLMVLSVGIGERSTMAYLGEICRRTRVKRVIHFGDCVTADPNLPVGTILYVSKAMDHEESFIPAQNLLHHAVKVLNENNVKAYPGVTFTEDRFLIDRKYIQNQETNILDFTAAGIYGLDKIYGDIEVLSILNVCENVSAHEVIGEAVRQSGGQTGIMSALQILTHHSDVLQ